MTRIRPVKPVTTPTKASLGLGNVDNTSDANKPVSTQQAAALALKQTKTPQRISACDFSFWYVNGEMGTSGTDIGRYSRLKTRAAVACHTLRVHFAAATGIGETALSGSAPAVTVRCSLEVGGVIHKAYNRAGGRDLVLDSEGWADLHVPGFEIPVGVDIWINTRMLVADGQKYPVGYSSTGANGEINSTIAATPATDFTVTIAGRPAASNLKTVHPICITGIPYTVQPCVALVGDSILVGKGDPAAANADNGPGGWAVRALSSDGSGRYAPRVPFVQVSNSGESAGNWATPAKRRARLQAITDAGATHAFVPFGANDIAGGVATTQASVLAVGTVLAGHGIKAYHATILPQTTSTDSWATLANQTALANNANRVTYNAWVRDGMPIDATTKAAVATGTSSNVLRVGATGHPFVGWFELADAVESARDSGKWKVTGVANAWTADGIHPSTTGHQAMRDATDVTAAVTSILAWAA